VCPAGSHVLGGGADIYAGGQGVHVSSMRPVAGQPDSFVVSAAEDALGYPNSWNIEATAICATVVNGWQIVEGSTFSPAGETDTSAQADCPAGKKVIGAGGWVINDTYYVLDDVMPDFDLSGVTVEAMHDGTPVSRDDSTMTIAYAVCAYPLPAQQMVYQVSAGGTGNKSVSVLCPDGTQVQGAGGGLSGAYGQAHFDRIATNGVAGLGGVDIDARVDLDGTPDSWQAWAFAICAA
jgi:hypothetical protein